jgi:hypothetical protein
MSMLEEFTSHQRAIQFEQLVVPIANRQGVLESELARLRTVEGCERSLFARLRQRLSRGEGRTAPVVDTAPVIAETPANR